MRMTIIPDDGCIIIDGEPLFKFDLSWIPQFTGCSGISTSVHAVQWYHDHGQVELCCNDANIEITELGVFEQAVTQYNQKKSEIPTQESSISPPEGGHVYLYEIPELPTIESP